jgi:hypothetical protein
MAYVSQADKKELAPQQGDMQMSYWNNKGEFQAKLETLHALINRMLSANGVKNTAKNKQLERLRKMKNQYYRLFNDGDPSRLLGVDRWFARSGQPEAKMAVADAAMSAQITAAWNEQEKLGNV